MLLQPRAPLPGRAPLPYSFRPSPSSSRPQPPFRGHDRSRSRSPLVDRDDPGPLSPSPAYLAAISRTPPVKSSIHPPLLVLNLNETLVHRGREDFRARKTATPRPYLSTFLEYICGWTAPTPGKPSQSAGVQQSTRLAPRSTSCPSFGPSLSHHRPRSSSPRKRPGSQAKMITCRLFGRERTSV